MPKATWQGQVIAESDATVVVDGNHYFPPDSINRDLLVQSELKTTCPWKGEASYYDVVVGDQIEKDAAWCYPITRDEAKHIEGYVAFWKGVEVK